MGIESIQYMDDKCFLFMTKGIPCRITYTGNHGWRLQTSKEGMAFSDMGAGQILANDLHEVPYLNVEPIQCRFENGYYILTASDNSYVKVEPAPLRIVFYSADGTEGAIITKIAVIYSHTVTVFGKLRRDERVYGTGERFDRINQRGRELRIFARDEWAQWKGNSYVPIPIVCSSVGYGLFMNRFEHIALDLDSKNDSTWEMCVLNDAPVDLYVFASDKLSDTLYGYSVITGFSPEPVEWMYGTQVCRYWPDFSTPEGVLDMEKAMAENNFPWEAVIMEGWDTYDPDKLESLKKLAEHLHANGKRILLYQACGMIPDNAEKSYGKKVDYSIHKVKDGSDFLEEVDSYNPADNPNGKKNGHVYVDITNTEAMDWWKNEVWGKLVNEAGVQGAKIDFCELFPEHEELAFKDGRPTAGTHHWYPVLYNTLMYRYYNSQPGGGMNLSRGGGIGAQRYPFLWAGDQMREWFYLKAILRAVLSSGLSGIPFMSYDMSAYRSGRDEETDPEAEVFVRGLEYTCFAANIQTHGKVLRPYDFDAEIRNIYRIYSNMHDALRPLLVEQGRISCKTGLPLMRALVLWDCRDTNCLDCEDEYMLGDAFLVAPVLDKADCRDVYLPNGKWKDLYDGTVYDGGTTIEKYRAPLVKIPAFVNCNSESTVLEKVLLAIRPYIDEIKQLSI